MNLRKKCTYVAIAAVFAAQTASAMTAIDRQVMTKIAIKAVEENKLKADTGSGLLMGIASI